MAHGCSRGAEERTEDSMEVEEEDGDCGGTLVLDHETEETEEKGFPPHWLKMRSDTPVVAVDVCKSHDEYNMVLAQFLTSFGPQRVEVRRIFRIQSAFLWRHFLLKREEMRLEHGGREVLERQLFHGTKCPSIDGIVRKGFDWRLSSRTKYGEGCYFAVNSHFSHTYSPVAEQIHDMPRILHSAVTLTPSPPPPPLPQNPHTPPPHHHRPFSAPPDQNLRLHLSGMTPVLPLALAAERQGHSLSSSSSSSQAFWHPSSPSSQSCWNCVVRTSSPLSPPSNPVAGGFSEHSTTTTTATMSPVGLRYMFVARVLVGRTVRGHPSYRRPPAVQPGDPCGVSFDTCVNDERDPSIFVVYDSNQAYPEYLLEYSCYD